MSCNFFFSPRATSTLEAERTAFEAEKKAHYELYEKQQQVCTVCVYVGRKVPEVNIGVDRNTRSRLEVLEVGWKVLAVDYMSTCNLINPLPPAGAEGHAGEPPSSE